MCMLGYISIGIFIDGGYYAKMNRALKAQESSIIRVRSLFDYICNRLAVEEGVDPSDCQITEAHYFRGRFRVREAYDKHLLTNASSRTRLSKMMWCSITNTLKRWSATAKPRL